MAKARVAAQPISWTRLTLPATMLAWLFVADTLVVSYIHVLPLRTDNPLWRHMAISSLGQNFTMLALSLLILLATAQLSGSVRLLTWSSRLCLVAFLLLMVLMVDYFVDSSTLSASLPEDQRPRFSWLVIKGVTQYLLGALVLIAAAVAARRFAAASEPEAAHKTA